MKREEVKISVVRATTGYGHTGLRLDVRTERWNLAEQVPGGFEVDGHLVTGTLAFLYDGHRRTPGKYSMTRSTDQKYDYTSIPIEHAGVPIEEPIAPIPGMVTVFEGLIQFDAIPGYEFIPRRLSKHLVVRRTLEIARECRGNLQELEAVLSRSARDCLYALRSGFQWFGPIPAHVEYLRFYETLCGGSKA